MEPQGKKDITIYTTSAATLADVTSISGKLRAADVDEALAAYGLPIEAALKYSVDVSDEAWIARDSEGEDVLLYGVASAQECPEVGVPWMVATPLLPRYGKSLMRDGMKWIDRIHKRYPILANMADARNTVHTAWLRRMGFTLLPAKTGLGFDPSVPFIQFLRTR